MSIDEIDTCGQDDDGYIIISDDDDDDDESLSVAIASTGKGYRITVAA